MSEFKFDLIVICHLWLGGEGEYDRLMTTESDPLIVVDADIQGGTPVIRGTRITVYAVLGRVDHGDTIEDILADNPDLSRDVVEAALAYARSRPRVERFAS